MSFRVINSTPLKHNYAEGGAIEVYCNRAVCPSVCLSVFYKHFSSLAKNYALKQATQADIDICSDLYLRTLGLKLCS